MVKVIPVIQRPRNTAKEQLLGATEKDMTHPNITNGASLEDCYTNFFALADLCGIKWKRLTTPDNWLPSATGDPLDDPVLKSFSKCLAAELLCVWRRVANNKFNGGHLGSADSSIVGGGGGGGNAKSGSGQGDGHPAYSKELWIFWYGEEPDVSKLSPNELIEAEQGSWENGLSYECRTLLFKAFHNLIERCLLSRGFARIGRWFLQPFESDIPPDKGSNASFNPDIGPVSSSASTSSSSSSSSSSTSLPSSDRNCSSQLSFAFNFFVHGESTVCASVDVRVLPPVFRLARRNLLAAQGSSCGLNVILSPYGVAGIITGQTFKDSDQSVQRLLQEWEKFYPLNLQSSKSGLSINGNSNGSSSNNRQAPMNVTPPFYVDCYDDVSVGVMNDPISSSSSFPLPSVVEVSVAGIKMKYPSSYIYIVPENYAKKTDDNSSAKSASRDNQSSQQHEQSQQSQQSQTSTQQQPKNQQTQQQTNNPTVNLLTPPNTPPELHQSYLAINSNRARSQILSPIQPQIPSSTCRIRNNAFQEMNVSHQSSKPVEQNSTSSSTIAASSSPTTSPSSLSTTTTTVTITTTASTTTSSPSISSANPSSTPNSNLGVTGVSGTSTPTPTSNLSSSSTPPTSITATTPSNGISGVSTTNVSGKATPTQSNSTLPSSVLSSTSPVTAQTDDLVAALAKWDFCDPSAKVPCSCHRCKAKKSNNQTSVNSKSLNNTSFYGSSGSGTNKKLDKNDKDRQNQKSSNKNVNPFHRRPMFFEELDVSAVQESSNSNNNNNNNNNINNNSSSTGAQSSSTGNNATITQPPSVQQPKTPSYLYKSPGMSGLASIQSNATTPGGTAIDSPRSCAPFSDGPASGLALDANLSSISPHPVRDDGNIYSQESCSNDPKGSNRMDGMSPHPGSVKGSGTGTVDSPAVGSANPLTPISGGQQAKLNENDPNNQQNVPPNSTEKQQEATTNGPNSLKRPMLPVDLNENDTGYSKKLLYDFSCIDTVTNIWDIPMPKNRRVIKGLNRPEIISNVSDHLLELSCLKPRDPYEFRDEEFPDFKSEPTEEEVRVECSGDVTNRPTEIVAPTTVQLSSVNQDDQIVSKEGPKSNAPAGMEDSSISSPKIQKKFTREEELKVSYDDLNMIFSSSSDEESSSEFSTPNAPKANKSLGIPQINGNTNLLTGLDDVSKSNNRSSSSTLAELTMIFPTPPSMEINTAPSPCNTLSGIDMTLIDDREKLDAYPNSPTSLDSAKDWSYVYKPPIQCKFLTSSKYAPLNDVASLTQYKPRPDCVYKQQEPSLPFQTVKSQSKPHSQHHPLQQNQQQQQQPHHHYQQLNHLYSDKHAHHQSQQNPSLSHHGPSTGLVSPSQSNPTNRSSGYFHQFGNSQQQNAMVQSHHAHPGMITPHQMNSHYSSQQSPHHHLNHHHPGQNQNMVLNRLSSGPFSPASQVHPNPPMMGSGVRMMRPTNDLRGNYPPNHQVSPFMQQGHQQTPNMYMNPQFPNSYGPGDRMISSNHPHFSPLMDSNGHQTPFANVNHPPYHHQISGNNSPHPGHHPPSSIGNISGPLGSLPYDVHSHQAPLIPGRPPLPATSPALPTIPDAHCLLINLVLSDSMLNLFKDHNFESCTLCACNGNIKGSDVGIYLPESLVPSDSDEPQYKCTCGFSAVANRHRSYFAGLFYEDEIEITGVVYDPLERLEKKPMIKSEISIKQEQNVEGKEIITSTNLYENDQLDASLVDLLRSQCSTLFSSSSLLAKAAIFESLRNKDDSDIVNINSSTSIPVLLNSMKVVTKKAFLLRLNALQRSDGCEIAYTALVAPKQVMNGQLSKLALQQLNTPERQTRKASCLHEWSFNNGSTASNNLDVVRLLRNLTPLLQKSVQKKPQAMWEVTYTVSGPLTWRQFHRLSGRGTEDQCEPQPIPSLLVGHDNDWVALSPFALKYWEKLMLEPYSVTRDVAYLVLAPDDTYVLSRVKTYFKELSTTYEMLRLGRHCPIAKVMRDGIMRVGKTVAKNIANEPIDDWFNQIGDGTVASKIKLYARACRYYVAPYLSSQTLDKSLFDNSSPKPDFNSTVNNSNRVPTASPHHPPDSMNTNDSKVNDDISEGASQGSSYTASHLQSDSSELDDDPNKQPVIVIYIVEPFTFANMDEEVYRLSCLGLLRCYAQMLNFLPEHLHNSINLQLVSLDAILGVGEDFRGSRRQDQLKALAFSVFNQCRKILVHHSVSKSLTGFGPAASLDLFLKSKDPNLSITRVYTPPYILAPLKDKQTELGEMFGDGREKSQILYCAYCLTEDQKWLVVTCSNDKGDLLESTLINIEIPNRTRRKKASAKKFGLHKILEFIFSVMTETVQPWRLVIGRLGRVGHGELREWNSLLSKKSLLRYSRLLREKCRQCSMMTPYEIPSILSACLVSLEADTALRVFPDHFTPDDRYNSSSSTCHLSTPEEASCTHILVFPTSAASSSSQAAFGIGDGGIGGINEDDLLQALGADGGTEDLPVGDDELDLFQWPESPTGSPGSRDPGLNHPDSPRQSGFDMNMKSSFGGDLGDDPTNLLQQPLALGYYVSTAQTGPLPKWFWSSAPHLADMNPAFLKSALLIHTPSVQQNNDDFCINNRNSHSLDSNLTTDVLRYVLEGYNSLSWISLDPATHDRLSCLPIHIQILMQLYHTVQALV